MRPHEAFGQNLKSMRQRRGFSLRQLVDTMRERNGGDALGLDHAGLSRLERGRRQVTVEQWLLIAAALDCPPLLLVVPLGRADTLELTATSSIHPEHAYRWMVGDWPLTTGRDLLFAGSVTEWHRMRAPLDLYERLVRWQDESLDVDQPGRPAQRPDAVKHYQALASILRDMAAAGVLAPHLDAWIVGRLAQLGHDPEGLGVRIWVPEGWFSDWGSPTPMRHPGLTYATQIPAELVDDYVAAGWTRSEA